MNKIINYENKLLIESNNIEFSSNTFITKNINISGNIYLDENSEIFANNITGVDGQILKKNSGNLKWITSSSDGISITSNNDAIFNNLTINGDASFSNRPYQNLLINGVSYEHLDGSYALAIDCAPKVSSQTAKELIENKVLYRAMSIASEERIKNYFTLESCSKIHFKTFSKLYNKLN